MKLLNQGEAIKKINQQKREDKELLARKEKLIQEIIYLENKKKMLIQEINNLNNN